MFQLNRELVPNVLEVFIPFKNLNELHHWYVPFTYTIISNYPSKLNKLNLRSANTHRGGDFYKDRLNKLIEIIGHQLVTLYFIHVDELDLASLALISNCNQLETLGLCNCSCATILLLY